jgi:ubiquinone biosynthesis protein
MHDELETMLTEELDFRVEATLIRDMRRNLRRHKIVVPRVFTRYCSKDVLVMSFVDGVLMADYLRLLATHPLRALEWLQENGINPKTVARRIYLSCQRQIFEDNLFHCDLHPGNIMLLKNSRFALLDFGAAGSLDLQTRKQVMLYHRLIAEGDLSRAMMVLTHMSSPVPQGDMAALMRRLVRVTQKSLRFMTVKDVPYEERIYSDATSRQLRILGQARIPVSWDFLRAQRTFTVLEMSMRQLDPGMEPMKLSRRYFRARERREQQAAGGRHEQLFNHVETLAADAAEVMRDLADVRALAGKIWGIGLNEVRAVGRRLLIGSATALAALAGMFWACRYYMNGAL